MRKPTSATRTCLAALAAAMCLLPVAGDGAAAPHPMRPPSGRDAMLEGFRHPPPVARPRVWWHWMNGNITEDGIRKDLTWMKRVGIGGVDIIDASIATPQVVKQRLVYMTPAWDRAFVYATRLAAKFGMEVSINSSPGWSETGGPWVRPDEAMKKVVWTETHIGGGAPVRVVLPRPPDTIGPFQNAPVSGDIAPSPAAAATHFYRDSVVIAYRTPVAPPHIVDIVSNNGPLNATALSDGNYLSSVELRPGDAGDVWIRAAFDKPTLVQGLSLAMTVTKGLGYAASVEASDNGADWRPVTVLPPPAQLERLVMIQQTVSFASVTARYLRVVLRPAPPLPRSLRPHDPAPGLIEPASTPSEPERIYRLYQLVFHAAATVHAFEQKAQFAAPPRDFYALAGPQQAAPSSAIDPGAVVVLTGRMSPDGTLDWNPPPGDWTVLRMGYSLTGAENHPATAEATGFEVDKLDRAAVHDYTEHYLGTYRRVTGPARPGMQGLNSIVVDSAETGMQNWTPQLLDAFRRVRGYDPVPWLPVLTGAVVRSPADSDRFLWDFRRTLAEMLARNHYGEIADVARAHGLATYMEAIEDHRPTFGDDTEMRRYATAPMGAMWTYGERWPSALTYEADLLGAASVAHVYGRPLVAAESLTSALRPWDFAPAGLKSFVDMEFARGVNRVVIHSSVHQPVDRPPGLSLGGYGQFFNRLDSWSAMARPWMDYIARSSFLLQQGRYVADIAYFYGQDAPLTGVFGNKPVDVPEGYAFDFVDADGLANELGVAGGALTTRSGMRYRVLYLGGSSRMMTLPVLKRIRDLAAAGAIVVGRRPEGTPSLADDKVAFDCLADDIFGSGDTPHALGRGTIYPSGDLAAALAAENIAPDFSYSHAAGRMIFLHRQLRDADIYFVSNRSDAPVATTAAFRTTRFPPQIWDAVDGSVRKAAFVRTAAATDVALNVPGHGAAFVVFRKPVAAAAPIAPTVAVRTLSGPWRVSFGNRVAETMPVLRSWTESANANVRYFSGTATYTTIFDMPAKALLGRLLLDLSDVREIAEVELNGHFVGTAWTAPYMLDISRALRPGRNRLQIRVANLWVNRLIGDAQPGNRIAHTFTVIPTYRADAPLRPSGLLGPVTVLRARSN